MVRGKIKKKMIIGKKWLGAKWEQNDGNKMVRGKIGKKIWLGAKSKKKIFKGKIEKNKMMEKQNW